MRSPVGDRLKKLARPRGTFAMLALDQRESLRTLLAEADAESTDDALTRFKVQAARSLTPHASAVLLDVDYGLAPVLAGKGIARGCGLIVAADTLDQQRGAAVEDTGVDEGVLADDRIAEVADAYKLLVIWRPDRGSDKRGRTVSRFIQACRRRKRPAIVEGIVRPATGREALSPVQHVTAVLAAARELGALGPDLYRAEVPTLGEADDDAVAQAASELSATLRCPWVVLSNGTPPPRFPDAAVAACRGGASGFLAGRAIWSASLAATDIAGDLETSAAARLRNLAARIDDVARPWAAALAAAKGKA
jgi:sulfofructosephosphate aldolase